MQDRLAAGSGELVDRFYACLPRLTAARIVSADLAQTNGLGLSLVSVMKRLIAA